MALGSKPHNRQQAGGVVLWDLIDCFVEAKCLMFELSSDLKAVPSQSRANHIFGRSGLVVPLDKVVDEL